MRILDILLGRTRPVPSQLDRLFAISTAYLTLTSDLQLTETGRAGVTFRPIDSAQFESLDTELEGVLRISGQETGTAVHTETDDFGFQWVTLQDTDFQELVSTIHLVSLSLQDKGFAGQLLAAVFKFLDRGEAVYWIYNYKRGSFYPFVPKGEGRDRDNALELRLKAAMEKELPIEQEMERWYPLWGVPL